MIEINSGEGGCTSPRSTCTYPLLTSQDNVLPSAKQSGKEPLENTGNGCSTLRNARTPSARIFEQPVCQILTRKRKRPANLRSLEYILHTAKQRLKALKSREIIYPIQGHASGRPVCLKFPCRPIRVNAGVRKYTETVYTIQFCCSIVPTCAKKLNTACASKQ